MNSFRLNEDGSLTPVVGSPFVTRSSLHLLTSLHNHLVAAGEDTLTAFVVDSETGAPRQTDGMKTGTISQLNVDAPGDTIVATTQAGPVAFRVSGGKLKVVPGAIAASELAAIKTQPSAVLDASGRFMFVVDTGKGELAAFRIENGRPIPLPSSTYPVPRGTAALALVRPQQ